MYSFFSTSRIVYNLSINMRFAIPVIFSIVLVSGIRSEAEPLAGSSLYKEGHHDYLQSFHHGGQHHPSVGSGSDVGSAGGSGVGVGHPVGVNQPIQDQNTAVVTQDQIAHQSAGQVGGHPGQGQIPVVHPGVPPFVQRAEFPHYFGRAIGSPYPYLYGKTYASPYYAPYQSASPYSGYYPSAYPYHYSSNPYSVTPYSSPAYSGPVGYSGYSGYPGANGYGYVPQYYPGYSPYYPQSSEVQQSPNKQ